MARGLTRNKTTTNIAMGFIRVDIEKLPTLLNVKLWLAIEASEKEVM